MHFARNDAVRVALDAVQPGKTFELVMAGAVKQVGDGLLSRKLRREESCDASAGLGRKVRFAILTPVPDAAIAGAGRLNHDKIRFAIVGDMLAGLRIVVAV